MKTKGRGSWESNYLKDVSDATSADCHLQLQKLKEEVEALQNEIKTLESCVGLIGSGIMRDALNRQYNSDTQQQVLTAGRDILKRRAGPPAWEVGKMFS